VELVGCDRETMCLPSSSVRIVNDTPHDPFVHTPSQTVGPYFAIALPWPDGPFVVPDGTPGAFWIRGRVTDGHGQPIPDALVESWQLASDGSAAGPGGFRGFGRCATDVDGRYGILTLKPGVPKEDPSEAPHLDITVFARGLLKQLITRMYFPDEPANEADPVLNGIGDEDARATLIARNANDGYQFDIRLQGERETVFFEL
jgi:protocatechuate 3,4-dioxygenase alpha subunit